MRSDWLQAFLTFSQTMNFTRAAAGLNISQPALHVKVGKLAEWAGQPLYRKVGRNLVLTPAGETVAAFAREEQERLKAFAGELRAGQSCRPVVLCAGAGAYLYLLGPAISRFSQNEAHPLKLLTGDREHTLQMVLTGQAHLGVTVPGATPAGIAAETLTDVGQMLVMPAGHRRSKRRKVTLADLQDEALIVPPQDRPHRIMLDRMLMNAGVAWRVAVEANGWELMLHFARLNMGLAIVNSCCHFPAGLTGRPLPELPKVRYRAGVRQHAGVEGLRTLLLETAYSWREDGAS